MLTTLPDQARREAESFLRDQLDPNFAYYPNAAEIELVFGPEHEFTETQQIADWWRRHRHYAALNVLCLPGCEWNPNDEWAGGRYPLQGAVARFWKRIETPVGVVFEIAIEVEQ